jgi:hypothetical protein
VDDFKKLALSAAIVIIAAISVSTIYVLPKSLGPQNAAFDEFLIGTGADAWSNLQDLNNDYSLNMNLATSWISSHDDLYGWWSSYYLPGPLWDQNFVPHLITYRYFTGTWDVDYSPASLDLHRQEWLNDLRFLANHLKAPNDGHHTALISLETEFNGKFAYENLDYTYWNQLMIDSKNAIKEVAPNVLVSYCIGSWEPRYNDDITMNGALTSSMESMDFMSFQAMWSLRDTEEAKWLKGDDLKTNYGDVNWVARFGDKSHVWNYMIDDIATNVKVLSKYNQHILLAHLSIDDYLWGPQAQVDVVNDLSQREGSLRAMGLFGISWMHYIDYHSIGGDGFLFQDGSSKPCLSPWRELISKVRS